MYDFATAAAEAAVMCRERSRNVALVSQAVHPDTLAVMNTYGFGTDTQVRTVPLQDGRTDLEALKTMLTEDVASLTIQQPNYFGQLEDVAALFQAAKEAGVKCILVVNPLSLSLLPSGAEVKADIVCGDVQPFGLPMMYGGPHAGFMACTKDMIRRLPGRIAGQTTDADGRRAFVLTLQAREQHIRREKASSNICTNHAHSALTASIYLTYMGLQGITAVAESSVSKAHYLAQELCKIKRREAAVFMASSFTSSLPISKTPPGWKPHCTSTVYLSGLATRRRHALGRDRKSKQGAAGCSRQTGTGGVRR